MNDNQIIQALKICRTDTTCCTCPYYSMKAANCMAELTNDALELIKKQREEINELTHKHYNECGQMPRYSDELSQFVGVGESADILEKWRLSPLVFIPSKEEFAETEKTLENVAKLEAISGKSLDDIISLFLKGCVLTADKSKTIDNLVSEYVTDINVGSIMTGGEENAD